MVVPVPRVVDGLGVGLVAFDQTRRQHFELPRDFVLATLYADAGISA